MKEHELSKASQEFLDEIRGQMDGDILLLFNSVISALEKPSAAQQQQLDLLQALLDGGVDNWPYYEEALIAAGLQEEEDEDD